MFDADGSFPALSGGGDIRFSEDAAGVTQLSIDVVVFTIDNDPANGTAEIHVKIPTLDFNDDTVIYVWYDKTGETQPAATTVPGGSEDVWTTRESQFHFTDQSDSTGNTSDFTLNGTASIGSGELTTPVSSSAEQSDSNQFEGQTSFSFHVVANTGNLTITSTNSPHRFFDKNGSVAAGGITTSHLRVWNQGWSDQSFAAGDDTDIDVWITYDGSTVTFYNNGSSLGTVSKTQTVGTGVGGFFIGNGSATQPNLWFPGTIKEFGFNYIEVTAAWIATEYNNRSAPGTFASAGTPETPSAPTGNPWYYYAQQKAA